MPFVNVTIATEAVEYNGGTIEVRGVSVADMMAAVRVHGPVMAMIFAKVQDRSDLGLDAESFQRVMGEVMQEAPEVVAAIIALAADEYNEAGLDMAGKFPAPVQIELAMAIFRMTFESESMLEKLVESVIEMMAGISGTLNKVTLPGSIAGIGDIAAARTYS
jgi:hypothetical protein